jgi:hypothetical protein
MILSPASCPSKDMVELLLYVKALTSKKSAAQSDLPDTVMIPLPQTENALLVELSFHLRSSVNAL